MIKKILVRLSIFFLLFFCYQLFWLFSLNNNENKLKKFSKEDNTFESSIFFKKRITLEKKQFQNNSYYEVNIQNRNFFHNETFYLLNKFNGKQPHNYFKEKEDIIIKYRILLFFVYELDYKIKLKVSKLENSYIYQYEILN